MKRSKVLLTLLCAAALVVTSVFGTMAYLTDDDAVTNTFTVGEVHINLDEEDITKDDESRTETGNTYDEILPGHTYVKDPTVTVLNDSEDSYVRMLVTVDYKAAADAVLAKHDYDSWFNFNTNWVVNGAPVTTKYTVGEGTEAVDMIKRTYEFRYKDIVNGDEGDNKLPALFTQISIPGALTNNELATMEGLTINIVAHAIQAEGFTDADDAWGHFAA